MGKNAALHAFCVFCKVYTSHETAEVLKTSAAYEN